MMKKQRTKEHVQLVNKINSYILPLLGLLFIVLAWKQQAKTTTSIMMVLIGILLVGYGIFRIHLIQKLMKDIESIDEAEYNKLYNDVVDLDD